jgi:hypothetical protein
MPEVENNKEIEYVRNLARRAFRNVTRIDPDEAAMKNIENKTEAPKNILPGNSISGLGIGITVGIVVCIAASFSGIPFNRTETVFIAAQFGLLGALMSYINS